MAVYMDLILKYKIHEICITVLIALLLICCEHKLYKYKFDWFNFLIFNIFNICF